MIAILKRIPWRALIILIMGIIIGLYLGSKGTLNVITKVFETETVAKALNKPTQETTVNNSVELNKPNLKKSENLSFKFEPATDQDPKQEITQVLDSCVVGQKAFSKFSNSLKRKINRELKR